MTDISGPTLEISITTTQLIRAGDLWSILQQASEAGDVRVKVDWNGMGLGPVVCTLAETGA